MAAKEGTEQPTQRRLEKARKEGMVARSADLGGWLLILGFSLAAPSIFSNFERSLVGFGVVSLSSTSTHVSKALSDLGQGLSLVAKLVIPVAAVVALALIAINVAQIGLRLTVSKLVPSLSNFSPARNLKRIFSAGPAVEVIKSLIKLVIVLAVAASIGFGSIGELTATSVSPLAVAEATASVALELVRVAAILGLGIALIDYGRSRAQLKRKLMMTRQEVKDEMKEHEGEPMVKARRRRLARELARRRMLLDVARADAVVVNPTHYAVALKYDPRTDPAPIVLAKGVDFLAASIKERAREHGVPVVIDAPLARALHKVVEVGEPIPPVLFLVVARLLAFVYRLSVTSRYFESHHRTVLEELPENLRQIA
jgi:flagellar biosynthetic protein FlhB